MIKYLNLLCLLACVAAALFTSQTTNADPEGLIGIASNGSIWLTYDNYNWSRVPGNVGSLCFGDFGTSGLVGGMALTPAGQIWLDQPSGPGNQFALTHIPGTLQTLAIGDFNADGVDNVAGLGFDDTIWYTTSLSSTSAWTNIPGALTSLVASDFAASNIEGLAGVAADNTIWINPSLASWLPVPGFLTTVTPCHFVEGQTAGLVGLASDNTIWYTNDLNTWKQIPGFLTSIVVGDFTGTGVDGVAGLASDGSIWYTTDLQTWKNIPGRLQSLISGYFRYDSTASLAGIASDGSIWYTTSMEFWNPIPGKLEKLYTIDGHNEIEIRKLFAAWAANFGSKNISQLMNLYSSSFLNLTQTKSDMQTFLTDQLGSASTVSVDVYPGNIIIDGLNATVIDLHLIIYINGISEIQGYVSAASNISANNDILGITSLHKESGHWLFYGDQQAYAVTAHSVHVQGSSTSSESYSTVASVELPYGVKTPTGTITGPGAPTAVAMSLQSGGSGWYPSYLSASMGLTSPPPAVPLSYTIDETDSSVEHILGGTVTRYVTGFATLESPADGASTTGQPTFTWAPLSTETGITYSLEVFDSQGYEVASGSNAVSPDSLLSSDGISLGVGEYTWIVTATDRDGNQSVTAPFGFIVS